MGVNLYKIRRKDGKYSNGGGNPTFSKKGKVWRDLADLKKHLALIKSHDRLSVYVAATVEVYAIEEEISLNPQDYIKEQGASNEDTSGS